MFNLGAQAGGAFCGSWKAAWKIFSLSPIFLLTEANLPVLARVLCKQSLPPAHIHLMNQQGERELLAQNWCLVCENYRPASREEEEEFGLEFALHS